MVPLPRVGAQGRTAASLLSHGAKRNGGGGPRVSAVVGALPPMPRQPRLFSTGGDFRCQRNTGFETHLRPFRSRGLQPASNWRMHEIQKYEEAAMALSVRLDPVLEARVEEEAKRLGVSKSDVVKDALEARLGLKNPYDLLLQARSGRPMGNPTASERAGEGLRARLRAKRSH